MPFYKKYETASEVISAVCNEYFTGIRGDSCKKCPLFGGCKAGGGTVIENYWERFPRELAEKLGLIYEKE